MTKHTHLNAIRAIQERDVRCIADKIWGEFDNLINLSTDYLYLDLKLYLPENFEKLSHQVLKEFENTAFKLTKKRVTARFIGRTKKKKLVKLKVSLV